MTAHPLCLFRRRDCNTPKPCTEPPYSVGQTSANDLNANTKYPSLDTRIEETYAKRSTATNKNSLYDSYIRAFRWASDRIGDAGIVAFVSNGGWIDGNTNDGMRLSLVEDFSRIYVYNLRGNQRTSGELSRKEGGKIFGAGSRNTVAIFIGVKDSRHTGLCEIFYRDIGDYLTREQKLRIVADSDVDSVGWQTIAPSPEGDWINQRDETFSTWPIIGDRKGTSGRPSVFAAYSRGVATGRDAWCYHYSRAELVGNVSEMLRQYEQAQSDFADYCAHQVITNPSEADATEYLAANPALTASGRVSWNTGLKQDLTQGRAIRWSEEAVRLASYRPFNREWVYFDSHLNERRYQLPSIFPTPHHTNLGFYILGLGATKSFSAFMTNVIADLNFYGSEGGQFFPRWTYQSVHNDGTLDLTGGDDVDQWGYRRVDNITDNILALYRTAVADQVTKDDIFYYAYAILHDPDYRTRYAADLKKMLPHIPPPDDAGRFIAIAEVGRRLAELHVNYEAAERYPLKVELSPEVDPDNRETWRVDKMRWRSKTDRSAIVYNAKVTIAGVPDQAHDYMLGSRTALEWIIDRYQIKTDKASGIVNDPNDWCDEHDDPTYIVTLIKKIITVSVETVALVEQLSR